MKTAAFLCAALLTVMTVMPGSLFAKEKKKDRQRLLEPSPGYVLARDLPDTFSARIATLDFRILDAFEGSRVHSEADRQLFEIGNLLHLESRRGTIARRLLFAEGDTVSKERLIESERALRAEEFLADAFIEVKPEADGSLSAKVTTFDQWSTTIPIGGQLYNDRLNYWFGLREANLLGLGQRIGFFYSHTQVRDMRYVDYANNAFTPYRLQLLSILAHQSDGYSYSAQLNRPFLSKDDRYAFYSSISGALATEYLYLDHNLLEREEVRRALPDSVSEDLNGDFEILQRWDDLGTHDFSASAFRSFGRRFKLNLGLSFDWRDRYHGGGTDTSDLGAVRGALGLPSSILDPRRRTDAFPGLVFTVSRADYKTVSNFRNLKWSENLDVGFRLTNKVGKNVEALGASNADFYLSHEAVFNDAFADRHFLYATASSNYFLSPAGDFDDGYLLLDGEYQFKPFSFTSTYLAAAFDRFFASEASRQLTLGGDAGLSGFPLFYYSGQARLLFEVEQRFFPSAEFATLVPAFAVFGNAGNTFASGSGADLQDLHYSAGFGLRLGLSKSTQKVVNHLNLSWPLDEGVRGPDWLLGGRISFLAKKTL